MFCQATGSERAGRPRRRCVARFGCYRAHLRRRGIKARIAHKGVESKERLGRHLWVVERTHVWLVGMGKLRIRFERRLDIHQAMLSLACSIICVRNLPGFC